MIQLLISVVPINEFVQIQKKEKNNSQSSLFFLNETLTGEMVIVKFMINYLPRESLPNFHLHIEYDIDLL